MLPDQPSVPQKAALMNHYALGLHGPDLMAEVLDNPYLGRLAVVSSFGAESVVLLHLVARVNPTTPILFIDTRMLFAETLEYQRDLARRLGLTDIRIVRARHLDLATSDAGDQLHLVDTDACCALRKTAPLNKALIGFDGWITGRKQFQSGTRAALKPFETEGKRIKVNPLAEWDTRQIAEYIAEHDLPRHPLVAKGYPSIGCAPCTSKVKKGEDPRSGRWRGQAKEECGIHFENGRIVRGPLTQQ